MYKYKFKKYENFSHLAFDVPRHSNYFQALIYDYEDCILSAPHKFKLNTFIAEYWNIVILDDFIKLGLAQDNNKYEIYDYMGNRIYVCDRLEEYEEEAFGTKTYSISCKSKSGSISVYSPGDIYFSNKTHVFAINNKRKEDEKLCQAILITKTKPHQSSAKSLRITL